MQNALADIIVYSPIGHPRLAVEVKRVKGVDDDWASKFRRNLLSEGLIPEKLFFLLVMQEQLYLWLPDTPLEQYAADYKAKTADVLGRFVELDELEEISGQDLEFLVSTWLRALVDSLVTKEDATELDWVLDSGLYEDIRDGSVKLEYQI